MLAQPSSIIFQSTNSLVEVTHNQKLRASYQAAIANHLPVALWRYPHDEARQAVVDFSGVAQPTAIDFTEQVAGFAFAPFVSNEGQMPLFIKASFYLDPVGQDFLSDENNFLIAKNRRRFLREYQNQLTNPSPESSWVTGPINRAVNKFFDETEYADLVDRAVTFIKANGVRKVVTSRAAETTLPVDFDPLTTFEALCQRYQNAFISLIAIPEVGTWIGATPEVLLELNNKHLRTVALAGTQPRPVDRSLDTVTWGDKEIEEQAFVSNDIRDFFRNLDIDNFTEDGPKTVSAGKIVHLQTEFKVSLPERDLLHLANQVLHDLHPTSAVCGMPREAALAFILEHERYNRAFYSGFLGPVHINQDSRLFVNLRCMQLRRHSAILYIGGGITQDSIPTAEWDETVLKSKTLLDILRPETTAVS